MLFCAQRLCLNQKKGYLLLILLNINWKGKNKFLTKYLKNSNYCEKEIAENRI